MTDDVMKDLVTKHNLTIEHLVESQIETNKQLKDISKFLAKQAVFGTRLESIDREVAEAFKRRDKERAEKDKRLHARISDVELLQKSESGCNSVRLLTKDVESIAKEVLRLSGSSEEHRILIQSIGKKQSSYPSKGSMITLLVIAIGYMVTLSIYTSKIDKATAEINTMMKREISDVATLMRERGRK